MARRYSFYEFFAGGGMARAGLGAGWNCLLANDFDARKAAAYRANWGGAGLLVADVAALSAADLPGRADLAWASFPCQDLSLAGAGRGLNGARSGAFWPFFRLMKALAGQDRAPALVALENVCGALTSHGGRDFAAICDAFVGLGYGVGALVMDARLFTPQSRPRLFVVAARDAVAGAGTPDPLWHDRHVIRAYERLAPATRRRWLWWAPPRAAGPNIGLADIVERHPQGVAWNPTDYTERLLGLMSERNRAKVAAARTAGRRVVGTIYRRTRADGDGLKVQRAEVRFDGVAGCLRTPAGGSSRQTVIEVDGATVRTRLLAPREAARLMGLPDDYVLPGVYNDAYHLVGDGVVAPVVRHLAAHVLEPILDARPAARRRRP